MKKTQFDFLKTPEPRDPNEFIDWTYRMIVLLGGNRSTAHKCAGVLAENMERNGLLKAAKK